MATREQCKLGGFPLFFCLITSFLIAMCASGTATAATKNPIPDGWYMIVSGNSDDKVLDIHGNSQANGGNLEICKKNNTNNQRFYLKYLNNGYYSIQVRHSWKYLHKANSGKTNDVHQWTGVGATNTQWELKSAGNGYYYIRSRSGNYLDNSGGRATDGNNVITYSFNGSAAQKWKFLSTSNGSDQNRSLSDGWYMIVSGNNNNKALDIHDYSQANGGNLEIFQKKDSTNQRFYLQYRNNGYYSILVQHSSKYLHKANSGKIDDVHQWAGYGADNTQWALQSDGKGYYYIRSKSGNYLDNSNGKTTDGNNVITHLFNGTNAQKWRFLKTSGPPSTLSFSPRNCRPGNGKLTQGRSYSIGGAITSNYKITLVTVGIYRNGKGVSTKTVKPNRTSFDINEVDKNITFGSLGVGQYEFKVTAQDESGKTSGNSLPFSYRFEVIAKSNPSPNSDYNTIATKTHETQGTSMCVLSSISMLIRSKLYLQNKSYGHITQWTVRNQYNNGRLAAYWSTICNNANAKSGAKGTLTYEFLYGNATTRKNKVINLLSSRKEGIVVYFCKNNGGHAVRFCNYSGGKFYVSDPASANMKYTTLENSWVSGHYGWGTQYWEKASPVVLVYYK